MLQNLRDLELEGVIAKRRDTKYTPRACSEAWLMHKTQRTAEFVIGGYTQAHTILTSCNQLS
jgi:bifunctional non-homologous end joining protein LigD